MHLFSASDLGKSYEGRTLFADVTFGMDAGDRVGVVGRNGSGKSTLLRLIAGVETPDAGRVVFNRAAQVAYLPQVVDHDPAATVREAAAPDDDPTVRVHEVEALLDRLGLDPVARLGALSGGQRRRVALARALLPGAELLILDEPTNHLDAGTIDWLEDELRERATALLLVTHDRYFLERLTTRMLEIDRAAVHEHPGSYSAVLEARARRRELAAAHEQRRQNLLRKEIAWLQRGPRARTSKPKFRLEQVERLRRAAPQPQEVQLELGTGRRRLGSDVLDLEDVTFAYPGQATPVLSDLEVGFAPGERAGIVGPNGSGKTTLLKLLSGELEPDAGRVRTGKTVEIGMYEQEATVPPLDRTVIDTVTDVAAWIPLANGEQLSTSALAERFGFDDRLQHAAVARLSGGERRRLALLHTLVRAPNVLILDEPTNDLDLETLRMLEDHLDGFHGTLIVATHDRYLLDRVTDVIYGLDGDGSVSTYRDAEHYHEVRVAAERERQRRDQAEREGAREASAAANRRRQEQMRRQRSLEGRLERLERERAEIHEQQVEHATEPERLRVLQERLDGVERELVEVEQAWLELAVE